MLYPNLAFGKYSFVQGDRTQEKNSSNGQGKLIQKRQPLFGLWGKPKYGNLIPDHKKAIRYASIIISDWRLGK